MKRTRLNNGEITWYESATLSLAYIMIVVGLLVCFSSIAKSTDLATPCLAPAKPHIITHHIALAQSCVAVMCYQPPALQEPLDPIFIPSYIPLMEPPADEPQDNQYYPNIYIPEPGYVPPYYDYGGNGITPQIISASPPSGTVLPPSGKSPTIAPELSTESRITALTLLCFGLVVLRGARKS